MKERPCCPQVEARLPRPCEAHLDRARQTPCELYRLPHGFGNARRADTRVPKQIRSTDGRLHRPTVNQKEDSTPFANPLAALGRRVLFCNSGRCLISGSFFRQRLIEQAATSVSPAAWRVHGQTVTGIS